MFAFQFATGAAWAFGNSTLKPRIPLLPLLNLPLQLGLGLSTFPLSGTLALWVLFYLVHHCGGSLM